MIYEENKAQIIETAPRIISPRSIYNRRIVSLKEDFILKGLNVLFILKSTFNNSCLFMPDFLKKL